MEVNFLLILISTLICLSILIFNPAKTYGVPAALVFIVFGLFVGNGVFFPAYDYPESTEFLSQFAISVIIFAGGFHTPVSKIKPVLAEGLLLANIGVLLTTGIFGLFAFWFTPLNMLESLLLGAIVSSTDAAATFNILESKKLKLKYNADKVLELESAVNDPMALILTLILCNLLLGDGDINIWGNLLFFLQQLIVGGIVSFIIAKAAIWIFGRIRFVEEALKPIFILALLLATTLTAQELGGNLLLASFVLGLVLGNSSFKFKKTSQKVFESFSWLAQALMFVLLGLQIYPKELLEVASIAWWPVLFLFFVARPLSIILSYLPLKQPFRKQLFISWVGIKGATPIVFALIPLIMDVPNASVIFSITVIVVLLSMILHGFSLGKVASWLNMIEKE